MILKRNRTDGNGREHNESKAEQNAKAEPAARPIIQVRGLRKEYPVDDECVVALERVDLDIARGQVCCIFGTSGSGKSTLLNHLAGFERPTRGAVRIGGAQISSMSEDELAKFRQKHLGFVFQSYNLLPQMTALENVAFPLMLRGMPKAKREKRALEMLKLVGLDGRASHFPRQMSGGQQQRVGIARAFVAMPDVVFADEPTGNLDTRTTAEVMAMICGFARKAHQTIVLVTHDPKMASYADRIVTLVDGRIVSDVLNIPTAVAPLDPCPDQEQTDTAPASIINTTPIKERLYA